MKLLFLTNIPSPYRVDFFNELGRFCDLTVIFEKRTSDHRHNSWLNYNIKNFKAVFLKGNYIKLPTAIYPSIKYVSDRSFDKIISADFTKPTGMLIVQYMKKRHIKYWLECDGAFAKSGKGLKEKIKRTIISGAEGYFSPNTSADEYFITYGASSDRIYRYPFTSLYQSDILNMVPSQLDKKLLRSEIGVTEEKMIVSVGRFIYEKGFDLLIKAAPCIGDSVGIYIIGGVPTQELLDLKNSINAVNVHFIDFKNKDELKKWYQAADLFVLPTRGDVWGLVINEAMANGLPVITTYRCGAGIELIQNGVNGFIVPTDNHEEIANKCNDLLNDKNKLYEMSVNNLNKIKSYTIDNMASRHIEVLENS
jgi:glycosyltransferase involved in cell wall biosynthesis